MFLNRGKRDAHLRSDLLVDEPSDHPAEDLELSWRQLCESRAAFRHFGSARKRLRYGRK
jgi:hypothetical protein